MTPKRKRNVAHLWADKRVLRMFRKTFSSVDYKNLRTIYLALCEMESDFHEEGIIKGFSKTLSSYSGLSDKTVSKYWRMIVKMNLASSRVIREKRTAIGSNLIMYMFEEDIDYQQLLDSNPTDSEKLDSTDSENSESENSDPIRKNKNTSYSNKKNKNPSGKKTPFPPFWNFFNDEFQSSKKFRKTWLEWIQHRKEKKSSLTSSTASKQAKALQKRGVKEAVKILDRSIMNGWRGIFFDDDSTKPKNKPLNSIDKFQEDIDNGAKVHINE